MIDCPSYHPSLPRLFDPHIPNNPALWAVLLGRHAGRALVDDQRNPTQCVLRTEACLTYASTNVQETFLSEAITAHRHAGKVWLIRKQGDTPKPECVQVSRRLEFYDCYPLSPELAELRSQLPQGYEIRPIDQALLERCEWGDEMVFYCGSRANFLRNDLGICLMHGEQIITEAYASAFGSEYAEIGAITREAYRGRGYASITVACLIELIERRGFHGYWSCEADNPASAGVARKLGFGIERAYEIWEYQPIRNAQVTV